MSEEAPPATPALDTLTLSRLVTAAQQPAQVLLRSHYQQLMRKGDALPALIDTEFRCCSQSGEDGILLYLSSILGSPHRTVVEVCAGNGIECNAANLLLNHAWRGLLFDGDAVQIAAGRAFYAAHENTRLGPPTMVSAWIDAKNIDDLIVTNGMSGEIDLLSLDLDGNDYWIWKAIRSIQPRVVVLEFNAVLGPDRALTLPYDPAFRLDFSKQPYKCGASLPAFVKLGREKGYRLIGTNALGFNAFFVRNDLGVDLLRELTPCDCFAQTERLRAYSQGWLDMMFTDGQRWDEV